MGHWGHAHLDQQYRRLARQLDHAVTGARQSPALMKILGLLFPPEHVALAARLPSLPTPVEVLSARLGIPEPALLDRLAELAHRGLVFDLEHEGRRYFSLAPVAFGFFEFAFMRVRDDVPQAELARLFEEYLEENDRAALRLVFDGPTQTARALVCEEALPPGDSTEVLDWERASRVVAGATALGVSLCACRHKAAHLGKACDRPQKVCLTLNYAADMVIRMGFAERITPAEGLRILEQSKEAGLAQLADNVQRRVAFICNCCGCCCEMFQAIRRLNLPHAVLTSNWIARIDPAACRGCGRCAAACPIGAIAATEGDRGPPGPANCREEVCLGCGLCYKACHSGALSMSPREQRVLAPETLFDRLARMAIERGKVAELVFEDPTRLAPRLVGRLVWLLERTPLEKALLAVRPLRSRFLTRAAALARQRTGSLADILQ